MKYKALMLDVDGTLVLNRRDGMPSQKVLKAIEKARKKVHVGIVTGRPSFYMEEIFECLKLSGPIVTDQGTQIIDSETKEILWEKTVNPEDIPKILSAIENKKDKFLVSIGKEEIAIDSKNIPDKIYGFFSREFTLNECREIEKALSDFPTIIVHRMLSWSNPNLLDIYISNSEATKQHGLLEAARRLRIDTENIIGVGDGYNDYPFLMACGLKIAMGNAIPEIKEIADFVAPSVEEDGVAWVIEKFILNET